MWNHIINLICLTLIIVFIVDLSGAIDTLKLLISRLITNNKIKSTNFELKPFDCSLCSCWWAGLIYLICTNNFTFTFIAFVALLAFLTNVFANILLIMKDSILTLLKIIQNKL